VTRRGRIIGFGSAAVLVVIGVLCLVLIHGKTAEIVGLAIMTLGLGEAVLLVFYEIGLSEDRELAKEQRQREKEAAAKRVRPHSSGGGSATRHRARRRGE
jgi:hypothetical protein